MATPLPASRQAPFRPALDQHQGPTATPPTSIAVGDTVPAACASAKTLAWLSGQHSLEAAHLVSTAFQRRHNAVVRHQYARLLALYADSGELLATTGLKRADEGSLMVERYLTAPVDQVLASQGLATSAPPRHTIMEVGALSSASPGAGRRLMLALVLVLEQLNIDWLVVTASRDVRNGLGRLGIALTPLASARRHCLPATENWGRYYEGDPRVVVIRPLQVALSMRSTPMGNMLLSSAPRLPAHAVTPTPALPPVPAPEFHCHG